MPTRPVCSLDRYAIGELSALLQPYVSEWDEQQIADFLTSNVNNSQYDKVPKGDQSGFTPENSISGFEASAFVNTLLQNQTLGDDSAQSRIGRGLVDIFLGGDPTFRTQPPDQNIFIRECHDGDTCRITVVQDPACRVHEADVSVRIGGIDTPEVSFNKLYENVDRLREYLLGKIRLPRAVERDINQLISTHIVYTGQLATIVRNDLNTWNGTAGLPRLWQASIIQWSWTEDGDITPPHLCGTWQVADRYFRMLGTIREVIPSYLESYMRRRLSELMATTGAGVYKKYRDKAREIIARLNGYTYESEEVKAKVMQLVGLFEDGMPDPADMFSEARCVEMADMFHQFVAEHGERYASDDQLFFVLTLLAYAYEKYRNQDGDAYQAAMEAARRKIFGLWVEPTFRALYESYEGVPRNHPPHCPAP